MLKQLGVDNVYVSTLPVSTAEATLRPIIFETKQSNRLIL